MKNLFITILNLATSSENLYKYLSIFTTSYDGRLIIDYSKLSSIFDLDDEESMIKDEMFQKTLSHMCGKPSMICVYKNKGVDEKACEVFICTEQTRGKFIGVNWLSTWRNL